jgi:hypothetical protein
VPEPGFLVVLPSTLLLSTAFRILSTVPFSVIRILKGPFSAFFRMYCEFNTGLFMPTADNNLTRVAGTMNAVAAAAHVSSSTMTMGDLPERDRGRDESILRDLF